MTNKLGRGGHPEDQLRGPTENLLNKLSRHVGLYDTVAYGEVDLKDLRARPDYAVDVGNARVGYLELKQPGRSVPLTPEWKPSDRERKQWLKLKALPNLVYTDGLVWRRYIYGEAATDAVRLPGDFKAKSKPLHAPDHRFLGLIQDFLLWEPTPPRSLAELINIVAGLCDLLHDEVFSILQGSPNHPAHEHISVLAGDWEDLLFPGLESDNFADAFAQTIAFSLLLARVDGISFDGVSLHGIGRQLSKKHSLIGQAFSVLAYGSTAEELRTIETMRRVIGAADLAGIDERDSDDHSDDDIYAELYERFLGVYDPEMRTLSGSFYTPAPLAKFMTRFTNQVLQTELSRPWGFADDVIVVDPAMGTGTFLLEVINCVADTVSHSLGPGARKDYLEDLISNRLVGFEIQIAAYAVAELRLHQALKRKFDVEIPEGELRFLTDALANPTARQEKLGAHYRVIETSREAANKIKRDWPVMAMIGNPPHVKDAKGRAPWIEKTPAIPVTPGRLVSQPSIHEFRANAKGRYESDLHGMEWYFWRWACWKVFEANSLETSGLVAFVTPCSFLTGQAFAGMREYLRRQCDIGWIINLSPEGNRPPGRTRIFNRDVGRQLCIAVFVRRGKTNFNKAADVHYLALQGTRAEKLKHLESIHPTSSEWAPCRSGFQATFRIAPAQAWDSYPTLDNLMPTRSRGVTAGRSWVYAPTPEVLKKRWDEFIAGDTPHRREWFHEKSRRNIDQILPPLPGFSRSNESLASEAGPCPEPVQVAYRSFDRQWLIPDKRLLAEARTGLWRVRDDDQIFVSEQDVQRIETGPGLTFAALIPDIDHFGGWGGGGVRPLWRDNNTKQANLAPGLLKFLSSILGVKISPKDFLAYVAAIAAHPAYTERFRKELEEPGIHVPLSTKPSVWEAAIAIGHRVIWLHTYGGRYFDEDAGRPADERAIIEQAGVKCTRAIHALPDRLPDHLTYNENTSNLYIGDGEFSPVIRRVVEYDVSGRRILWRWLNDRTRQPRFKKQTAPQLDNITVENWGRSLTFELLGLLAVLTCCVRLEDAQRRLLDEVRDSPTITVDDLRHAGVGLGSFELSMTDIVAKQYTGTETLFSA